MRLPVADRNYLTAYSWWSKDNLATLRTKSDAQGAPDFGLLQFCHIDREISHAPEFRGVGDEVFTLVTALC